MVLRLSIAEFAPHFHEASGATYRSERHTVNGSRTLLTATWLFLGAKFLIYARVSAVAQSALSLEVIADKSIHIAPKA